VVSKNANSHLRTCPLAFGTNLRSNKVGCERLYVPMGVSIFANLLDLTPCGLNRMHVDVRHYS